MLKARLNLAKANLAPKVKNSVLNLEASVLALSTTPASSTTLFPSISSILLLPTSINLLDAKPLMVQNIELNGKTIQLKP